MAHHDDVYRQQVQAVSASVSPVAELLDGVMLTVSASRCRQFRKSAGAGRSLVEQVDNRLAAQLGTFLMSRQLISRMFSAVEIRSSMSFRQVPQGNVFMRTRPCQLPPIFQYHFNRLVCSVKNHLDILFLAGRHVAPHKIGTDRQLAVAAVNQHAAESTGATKSISASIAARIVQDVIDQDDLLPQRTEYRSCRPGGAAAGRNNHRDRG